MSAEFKNAKYIFDIAVLKVPLTGLFLGVCV